jgi:hypothetical protein
MTNYGGHLPRASCTDGAVETDIQPPPLPAPEIPTSVPEGVSTGTLTRLSQIEQPAQCSLVDNESDLESNSGSEAGSISAHGSQVDTDVEISGVKSGGRRKPQRKISTLNTQYQVEDDREFLTIYAPKPAVPPCHSDGRRGLDPPGSPQHPRLNTGRATLRPPVVTKGPACLGETCEGGILSQNGMNLS